METAFRHLARNLLVLVITVLTLAVIPASHIQTLHAVAPAEVTGVVMDEEGHPLAGANVSLLNRNNALRATTLTDSAGRFRMDVYEFGTFTVVVLCDLQQTSGMDYVPETWEVTLSSGASMSKQFNLRKGATIYMQGEVRHVESRSPSDGVSFYIQEPTSEETISPITWEEESSNYYDDIRMTLWSSVRWDYGVLGALGFDERYVIVPANVDVQIIVIAAFEGEDPFTGEQKNFIYEFWVKGKAGFFRLSQGEYLLFNLEETVILSNIETVKSLMGAAFYQLEDCLDAGFMVNVERRELLNSYASVGEATLLLNKESYAESFAKTRHAYLTVIKTKDFLQGLVETSFQSAIALLFLFSFVAVAASYLVSEKKSSLQILAGKRSLSFPITTLVGVAFYTLLVGFFYYIFPGCHLVPQLQFSSITVLALLIGQAAIVVPQKLRKEKPSEYRSIQIKSALITAFSLSSRNLRRRRLRTTLSLVNIMVLVFGFITLTSISPGYGLVTRRLRPVYSVDAVLVRDESGGEMLPFVTLSDSFIKWLETQPNVTVVSKKAENEPVYLMFPENELTAVTGNSTVIFGVLGIVPSLEANLTNFDDVVVEGSYLEDNDLRGILVSNSTKEDLGVHVGDKVYIYNQEFIIRGFFDPEKLSNLRDIDGSLMVPYGINLYTGLVPLNAEVVVVLTYERAVSLKQASASRVVLQLKSPEDCEAIGQVVALTYEYKVYVSHPGSLVREEMGGYVEEKGMAMVPLLMSLVIFNIAVSMIGSVKERKDEIASLSAIGLNPTHIATLFVAEAAIIGIIGGGLGYLSGISGYRLASSSILGALEVREKASAEWGLAAIILSVTTAILAALFPSLRASTMVTPSLLRKWRIGQSERPQKIGQPYVVDLPLKLMPREVDSFTGFVINRMQEYTRTTIGKIRLEEETSEKGVLKKIGFEYFIIKGGKTDNELVIQPEDGPQLGLVLYCIPALPTQLDEAVHETASFVRKVLFEWNAMTFEVAAPYDPSLSQLYNLVNSYNPTTLYIVATQLDVETRLETLKQALVTKGIRIPRFIISQVDPFDIKKIMKVAEEVVSRADVICVSGEPPAILSALATYAARQKKIACYVVDRRPIEARMKNPFQDLKIENVT